jgi:hypothetical protein
LSKDGTISPNKVRKIIGNPAFLMNIMKLMINTEGRPRHSYPISDIELCSIIISLTYFNPVIRLDSRYKSIEMIQRVKITMSISIETRNPY